MGFIGPFSSSSVLEAGREFSGAFELGLNNLAVNFDELTFLIDHANECCAMRTLDADAIPRDCLVEERFGTILRFHYNHANERW